MEESHQWDKTNQIATFKAYFKEHDLYNMHLTEYGYENSKAVEKMAKFLRWSKQMINNILKK